MLSQRGVLETAQSLCQKTQAGGGLCPLLAEWLPAGHSCVEWPFFPRSQWKRVTFALWTIRGRRKAHPRWDGLSSRPDF